MKIPLIKKRKSSSEGINMDFLESMKITDDIAVEDFFKTLGYLLKNFKLGNITKVSTEQILIELMNIISKHQNIDYTTKNRFFITLFQELKNIQKSRQSTEIILISGIKLNSFLLKHLELSNIYFIGCTFSEADLSQSIFKNCEFRGCSFVESDLSKIKFVKCKFIGCDFEGATLEKTVGL